MEILVLFVGMFGTIWLMGALYGEDGCTATAGIAAIGFAILMINLATLEAAGWIALAIGSLIGFWVVDA